jgi:arginine/ornithine transport system substrate-binding protein
MRAAALLLLAAVSTGALPAFAAEPARQGPVQLIPAKPPATAPAPRSKPPAQAAGAPAAPAAAAPRTPAPPAAAARPPTPSPAAAATKPVATPPPAQAAAVAKPPSLPEAALPGVVGRTLRVGVEGSYPPFSEFTPEGKIRGFDIDMANALCAEIKAKCQLVQQDFDRLQDGLVERRTDLVVASLSMTDDRRKRYAFTDKYYQVPAKFVALRSTAQGFDPATLKGVEVGVLAGSVHQSFLVDHFGGVVRVTPFHTLPEAIQALRESRVRLVFGDALALDRDFLRAEGGSDLTFAGPSLADPEWFGEGVGIALRKDEPTLRQALNSALTRLRADGRYQTMAERYFGFDIYGGQVLPGRERRKVTVPPRPRRDLPQLIDGTTARNL